MPSIHLKLNCQNPSFKLLLILTQLGIFPFPFLLSHSFLPSCTSFPPSHHPFTFHLSPFLPPCLLVHSIFPSSFSLLCLLSFLFIPPLPSFLPYFFPYKIVYTTPLSPMSQLTSSLWGLFIF